jgi:small-conductance mechanosensitive channel
MFEHFLFRDLLNPATGTGALFYAALFFVIAGVLAALLRRGVNKVLARDKVGRIDRTYAIFITQLLQIAVYLSFFILFTHLIPELHSLAMALLTGVSVVSVVLGLAAQNTLGNLVSGVALLLYRPFRVGDTIEVTAPKGHETGVVDSISLGFTILVTSDHRRVMVPNSAIMNQTTVNLTYADDDR